MRPASAEVGAYLLFEMDTGEVIAQHEATRPWYPASLTKLMTAYVTFEAIRDGELTLTSPVTISPQARRQPPSKMGFALGTTITVETALRIILTKSANDVAVALAEAVGGTQKGFEERMNAAADALGMTATHYDNPHGLPDRDQVTTARDVALLMMALAQDFPDRADFLDMSGVSLAGRVYRNYNALIRRFEGADGMKTGFICASGFNLAATATRDGVRLGAVVLGGLTARERNERTAELLEKGFEAVRTGGRVALDGFGDVEARLALAPVGGSRAPMGTVAELSPRTDATVANRRAEVCGAERPPTRYDGGTVDTVEAVEAQRAAVAAWEEERAALEIRREKALSGPRAVPRSWWTAQQRRPADPPLAPEGWDPDNTIVAPVAHPRRTGGAAPREQAAPSLAPEGWRPAPPQPLPNPLEVADARGPLPEPPTRRPLSYLAPARSIAPVTIAMGGADPTRPDPMSGTVVGGGPPPRPVPKPPVPSLFETSAEPDSLLEHVEAVRSKVNGPGKESDGS
jgi:D-alanyl-D-alanine carboxypeptidase